MSHAFLPMGWVPLSRYFLPMGWVPLSRYVPLLPCQESGRRACDSDEDQKGNSNHVVGGSELVGGDVVVAESVKEWVSGAGPMLEAAASRATHPWVIGQVLLLPVLCAVVFAAVCVVMRPVAVRFCEY